MIVLALIQLCPLQKLKEDEREWLYPKNIKYTYTCFEGLINAVKYYNLCCSLHFTERDILNFKFTSLT